MPCRFVIDIQRRLVVTTAWDRLTFAEMQAHQDQLKDHPEFDPKFNQLVDLTAVTAMDTSVNEVKTIGLGCSFFSSSSLRAYVAKDPAIFGMWRLMEAYHSVGGGKDQMRIFYELPAALEWLGLDSQVGLRQP
jgi:hypothetical protein